MVKIAGIFSIIDSIVKGSGTQQGQFGYITRIALDSAGNMFITDTKNNRLQKFDRSGNFIFMDSSFLMPLGLTISSQNEVLVSDFDRKTVVKMDLAGARTGAFFTTGRPLGALSINEKHHIVSDSGIEILNNSGGLIQLTRLNNGAYNAGDIAADDSGAIAIVFDDKVYRFDKDNNTLAMLYQLPEKYSNQNGRVVFLRPGIILVMTTHANGPARTTILALHQSGEMIAKWTSGENITDISPKNDKEIFAVTYNGTILRLIVKKEFD
jgi:DNA-binding beta-propeller fold protein YncE